MKTMEVIFEPNTNDGVYAISLVENPAIEVNFIALKEGEEMQFSVVEEEKRLLMGAVLIPNQKILRYDGNNEPFFVMFKEQTIRQAQEFFYKNGHQSNSTLEHNYKMQLENVTFVESWIKEDLVHDKSVKYGFDQPVGTWFATMKVDNDEVWAKVKAGELKGFSIDGVFNFKNDDMDFEKIVEAIKNGFNSVTMAKEEVAAEVVTEPQTEIVQLMEEPETEEVVKEDVNFEEIAKFVAEQVAIGIEKLKSELQLQIDEMKPKEEKEEEVQLTKVTKAKPESVNKNEAKDFKSRMLNRLNNN